MKKIIILLLLTQHQNIYAQGTFAGSFKSLIGREYVELKELTELEGFTSRGGTMLNDINDPEKFLGSWFSKGTLVVAIFEVMGENDTRKILDVLEIKNVKSNQELKIGECRDGEAENPGLVALATTSEAERWKALKAWNFNLDKVRIETFSPARVTCLGMIGD